jgi:hypothetical protein
MTVVSNGFRHRVLAHNLSGGTTAWEQQGLDATTPGTTR